MERIIKSTVHTDFSVIPNEVNRRTDISLKATGLYCYLNSLPPHWEIFKNEIVNHFTDGKDSLNAAFLELEKLGYLTKSPQKNISGFTSNNYIFHSFPFGVMPVQIVAENPTTVAENPSRALRKTRHVTVAENPPLVNTKSLVNKQREKKESHAQIENFDPFLKPSQWVEFLNNNEGFEMVNQLHLQIARINLNPKSEIDKFYHARCLSGAKTKENLIDHCWNWIRQQTEIQKQKAIKPLYNGQKEEVKTMDFNALKEKHRLKMEAEDMRIAENKRS